MPEIFIPITLSLHIVIPFWIMVGLAVITAILWLIGWQEDRRSQYHDGEGWYFGATLSGVLAAIMLLGTVASLIPFDAKYHHLYAVEGQVTEVSNVLTEGSGDLTYAPVVELEGEDFVLVVRDSRAASLEGERVTFTCSVEWVYHGADIYNCGIGAVHR